MNDIYGQKVYLNAPVRESGFSVLTTNRLLNSGIKTLRELVQKTEEGISNSRYFGKKAFDEIKARLSELNLCLGMSEADIKAIEEPETNNVKVSDLTIRDYFAIHALTGSISNTGNSEFLDGQQAIRFAREAYLVADAMLEVRGKIDE